MLLRNRKAFRVKYPADHLVRAAIGLVMLYGVSECFRELQLADAYANQVIELESKLADAEVKKKGEMADLGLVGEETEPETTDNSERVPKVGDLSNDEGAGAGRNFYTGLTDKDGSPDK